MQSQNQKPGDSNKIDFFRSSENRDISFLQLLKDKKCLVSDINDFVQHWHTSDLTIGLSEALGFAHDELEMFALDPDGLFELLRQRYGCKI